MRLKIWSAQDGTCPRTLIGHTGGQGAQYSPGGSNEIHISPQASLILLLLTEEEILCVRDHHNMWYCCKHPP